MPDGDVLHSGLSGMYQKPYRILCEGKFEVNECARIITGALLKDIKKKGADPIVLAKQMGELLSQEIKDFSNHKFVNWADLSRKLDKLAQQTNIPNRTKSLVLDAGKHILHDLRYGQRVDSTNIPELVIERYMQKMYVSNFEERIPLTPNHHANVDQVILTKRINSLQPDIFSQFSQWAKKANLDEDVANLKRTRRSQIKEIDLEENLL
ncbi:hypothetical protein ACX27_08635 [Nostoc piscinale CENA21]|uniref:Uncharacterized protein n=1 Tax=Nostoc piscinale CENA21 TaxID=224013 RepID=A0A0M5MGJ5_9NOSO|nr:hypothetical protein [Nostoc piscinale]ALF52912.1 hypothetical protein ACX27_08635 [Nostoc piscinale CENA21]